MIRIPRRTVLAALAAVPALPMAARAASHEIRIEDRAFVPPSVDAAPGDTITFVNADAVAHTATADDASFDTGRIRPGESATVTVAGATGFVCRFHPKMKGAVNG